MLSIFECESLKDFGSIFVLDSKDAVVASKLDEFIVKYPPYRMVGLTLYEDNAPIYITHILLFVNGYAVNIFAQEEYLAHIVTNSYKESEVS